MYFLIFFQKTNELGGVEILIHSGLDINGSYCQSFVCYTFHPHRVVDYPLIYKRYIHCSILSQSVNEKKSSDRKCLWVFCLLRVELSATANYTT